MRTAIALTFAALGLAACTTATGTATSVLHPRIDAYCADTPRAVRESARLSLGTTEAGNQLMVKCAVDQPATAPEG